MHLSNVERFLFQVQERVPRPSGRGVWTKEEGSCILSYDGKAPGNLLRCDASKQFTGVAVVLSNWPRGYASEKRSKGWTEDGREGINGADGRT